MHALRVLDKSSSQTIFHHNPAPRENISYTDNPLYTDTRYDDKICYNDNLTVTKPSLKR